MTKILFLFWDVATNFSAIVRRLLPTVETHLIRPIRQREWPAEIAMSATKQELEG
jgi:hypothetical protein